MPNPRTIAGDGYSVRRDHFLLGIVGTLKQSRLFNRLGWCLGRFNFLTGVATLGVASAILVLFRGKGENRSQAALSLVPLMLEALNFLFLSDRNHKRPR